MRPHARHDAGLTRQQRAEILEADAAVGNIAKANAANADRRVFTPSAAPRLLYENAHASPHCPNTPPLRWRRIAGQFVMDRLTLRSR